VAVYKRATTPQESIISAAAVGGIRGLQAKPGLYQTDNRHLQHELR
jgi:hypothetical protein